MTMIIDGTNGLTFPDSSQQYNGYYSFKNRIINGAMVIDQRNAGASVTPTNAQYSVDRWQAGLTAASKFSLQQNAGAVTPPSGFTNYLGAVSLSAYSVASGDTFLIQQPIEGLNIADLAWGTANAATVTLSFWVRSSLTGTFGGSLTNSGSVRSYPFNYTISAANTWEQKSITIAGDTSGTWLTTSGVGITVRFGLGSGATFSGTAGSWAAGNLVQPTGSVSVVGTNGATFYITGVQLEKGSTATSFDYRPYGTELQLCQRYYYRDTPGAVSVGMCSGGFNVSTTAAIGIIVFPVVMRAAPSALEQSGTAGNYQINYSGTATACSAVPAFNSATTKYGYVLGTVASGLTNGYASILATSAASGTNAYLGWSAEL